MVSGRFAVRKGAQEKAKGRRGRGEILAVGEDVDAEEVDEEGGYRER